MRNPDTGRTRAGQVLLVIATTRSYCGDEVMVMGSCAGWNLQKNFRVLK